ncbi:MAG: class I SAM-dependent methyltransferase [Cyanobium sp.]
MQLDFEGEHGRLYRKRIRAFVPGYTLMHQLAVAALLAHQPQPRQLLVVGPGPGEELLAMAQQLPSAQVTVVEPSPAMASACREALAGLPLLAARVELIEAPLEASDLGERRFDAVVCHNVLHVLPQEQHRLLLEQLARCVAPGGCLILSAYSEENESRVVSLRRRVMRQRLNLVGLSPANSDRIMAGRGEAYMPLDPELLRRWAEDTGLEEPVPLMQVLQHRLWLVLRPSS